MTLGPLTSTLTLTATGGASPDEAWDRYAVLDRWADWSPQITGVSATGPRLQPGLTGAVHGPLGLRVPFVVEAVDERARTWAWRVRVGPLPLDLHHVVTRTTAGCATSLRVRGATPLVLGYAPLARLALSRLVRP